VPESRKEGMRRWLLLSLATALLAAPPALADVYVIIANTTVHGGGYLRGTGDGSRLPFYLVPERLAPLGYRCHGNNFCAPRTKRSPRKPYISSGAFAVPATSTRSSTSVSASRWSVRADTRS